MTSYGRGWSERGVVEYETGADWIRCKFRDGSTYLYDAERPGPDHVANMQELATAGSGLTTYINQYVRHDYARKER